ncbi:MAG TPA: DUF2442 domain-containing protein [Chitinivibrionales bacterium]|nr:DUF2442 domain-containing protein [Chitinivibrionales bacterium]
MKSKTVGKSISAVEITDVTSHGVWLIAKAHEYFLSFVDFPWFREAKVSAVLDVSLLHATHLHWPQMDVDLELASLESLEKYPLRYK